MTPFGAVPIPSHTGSVAWHMLQRVDTISSTAAKFGDAGRAPVTAWRGPAADSKAMAIMPAAATPHTHQGDGLSACRALKKCRITGPRASTIATISQL